MVEFFMNKFAFFLIFQLFGVAVIDAAHLSISDRYALNEEFFKAVNARNVPATEECLTLGADVHYEKGGESALNNACFGVYGELNPDLVLLLLQHGANPNRRDISVPLHKIFCSLDYKEDVEMQRRIYQIAKYLLQHGASPNPDHRNSSQGGYSLLTFFHWGSHEPARNDFCCNMVKLLLEYGAAIESSTPQGRYVYRRISNLATDHQPALAHAEKIKEIYDEEIEYRKQEAALRQGVAAFCFEKPNTMIGFAMYTMLIRPEPERIDARAQIQAAKLLKDSSVAD